MPDGSDMLTRLRGQRGRPRATVPAGSRVYAIGDIHGHEPLLRMLHARIAIDMAAYPERRKVLVYLGDYVDRGPQSRATIDLVLDADLPADETIHLLGNHEQTMLDFMVDPEGNRGWLSYGGIETLASYGIFLDTMAHGAGIGLDRVAGRLSAALPARHRRFLEGLASSHVEGDYLFVHAGVRPGVPLDAQDREDLMWIRDEFLESGLDHGKVVVHGHSIRREPEIRSNRIGIDTGAFASGRLTALVLDGDQMQFLQTDGWPAER
jgi:serine/threonine protein phosphatase 1